MLVLSYYIRFSHEASVSRYTILSADVIGCCILISFSVMYSWPKLHPETKPTKEKLSNFKSWKIARKLEQTAIMSVHVLTLQPNGRIQLSIQLMA